MDFVLVMEIIFVFELLMFASTESCQTKQEYMNMTPVNL